MDSYINTDLASGIRLQCDHQALLGCPICGHSIYVVNHVNIAYYAVSDRIIHYRITIYRNLL